MLVNQCNDLSCFSIDEILRLAIHLSSFLSLRTLESKGSRAELQETSDTTFRGALIGATSEASEGIGNYVDFYNQERPRQSLNYATPTEAYFDIGS